MRAMTTHASTSSPNWAPSARRGRQLGANIPAHAPLHGKDAKTQVAKAVRQPPLARSARPTPWDWLFPSFFLCVVVAALPLAGLHWTYPGSTAAWHALGDTMLLSLPIVIPLPFLLAGCIVALAVQPATRTPAAFGFLGVALLVGALGMHAVLSIV